MHILDYVFFWPMLILKWFPWFQNRDLQDQFTISFVIAALLYSVAIIYVAICVSA